MVGLSIVLESHPKSSSNTTTSCGVSNNTATVFDNKIPQVINKTNMIISSNPFLAPSYTTNSLPSSSSSSSSSSSTSFLPFLEHCFLCGQKLLPGKDIYMYKGDRGFCSVECRYRQIFMDEEDCYRKENCSFSAIKPTPNNSETSSNPRRQRKSTKR